MATRNGMTFEADRSWGDSVRAQQAAMSSCENVVSH